MSNRRDEAIDRLLGGLSGREGRGASADCLDAEMLAAWMENQLHGPARARADAHAAACAHCQSMLAAMARTADAAAEPHAAPAAGSRFWRMLPWAGPLTAAAAAAAVYVAVRPGVDPAAPVLQGPPPALTEPARERASSEAAPAENSSPRADASLGAAAARQQAEGARQERRESRAVEALGNVADLQKDERARQQAARLEDAFRPAVPSTVAPEPGPPPLPAAKTPQAPPPAPVRVVADAKASTARFAQPPLQRTEPAAAAPKPAPVLAEAVAVSAPVLIPTPDPAVGWRIVANSNVQRSTDSGATWSTQRTNVPATLIAGAAPAANVCWIVGHAGIVLRTTDGRTWQRVGFPEPVDLNAVMATSAEAATVTTADGRTFTTNDGGRTWQRTPGR